MENLHKAIWEMFDDFRQPSAKGGAYPTPWIWPEEAHADAAVYDEQKKMAEWYAMFGCDPLKSEQWKVAKVLAKLCEENGWKHNDRAWWHLHEHRYIIDPTPDKEAVRLQKKHEHVATSDALNIDKLALARMMRGMLDDDIYHAEKKGYEGDDLAGFVCAMLAKENDWVMTEPEKCWPRTTYVKVYRIR